MEELSFHEIDDTVRLTANDAMFEKNVYGDWESYLTAICKVEDSRAFTTFHNRLAAMQQELVHDAMYSKEHGGLVMAFYEYRDSIGVKSLQYGFKFGMVFNASLYFNETGSPSFDNIESLDQHINAIFDDIAATSNGGRDAPWTLRLFADNFYSRVADQSTKELLDTLLNEICSDKNAKEPDEFEDAAAAETYAENFKRGFAIARRAYELYTVDNTYY